MLNKELILVNESPLEYTHIIVVGKKFPGWGYEQPSTGSISPSDYLGYETFYVSIFKLFSDNTGVSQLWFDESVADDFWVGRTDTKQVLRFRDSGDYIGKLESRSPLFSSSDVGKAINLWISHKAPLGHKNSQEHPTEESVDAEQRNANDRWSEEWDANGGCYDNVLLVCQRVLYKRYYRDNSITWHLQIPKQHGKRGTSRRTRGCTNIHKYGNDQQVFLDDYRSNKGCTNSRYFRRLELTSKEALYA